MQIQYQPQKYLEYVKQYKPQSQLMRYFHLFDINQKELATKLQNYFLELALDNQLVGSYAHILTLFNMKSHPTYQARKDKIEDQIIKIINQLKKQLLVVRGKGNAQEIGRMTIKIASQLFKYGIYNEAQDYLKKVKQISEVPTDTYYPLWVKINILTKKFEASKGMNLNPEKDRKITPEIKTFYICQDLRQISEGRQNYFSNLLPLNLQQNQISNDITTQKDLGDYYSLLTLASGSRENSSRYVKWSSKIEKLHINFRYKQLIEVVNLCLQEYTFDPFIGKRIDSIRKKIQANIFREVLQAYKIIKVKDLAKQIGIPESDIRMLLNNNSNSSQSYLIDPITETVNLVQQKSKLLQNIETIVNSLKLKQMRILRHKFRNEQERMFARHQDDDDDDMMGMGGMGMGGIGMGGMGMGMGVIGRNFMR